MQVMGVGIGEFLLMCLIIVSPVLVVVFFLTRSRRRSAFGDLPPAGWFVDPVCGDRLRYWDGGSWTNWVSEDGSVRDGGQLE